MPATTRPTQSPAKPNGNGMISRPVDATTVDRINAARGDKPRKPRVWDDWLSKAAATDVKPNATLFLDHFYLTLQAALDGFGIAMAPTTLVSDDLAQGRLVAPFDGPLLPARSYCAYLTEAAEKQPLPSAFRSWLGGEGNIAHEVAQARSRKSSTT